MAKRGGLALAEEVAAALARSEPVVALESTIITHGMPFPQNLDMVLGVESLVREHGATPATVAIVQGRLCVGLDAPTLEFLARAGPEAAKASRRDLSGLVATGGTAGTTVATTMQLAAMAGIAVFATGGIGGVHRGAELSFDVSADLEELSRTPVAVVCAGAKSILDIAKTLEVLETKGVPVIGFGTDAFPAFFSRESGQAVSRRVDDVATLARIVATQRALGMGGVLVANPIPEADALAGEAMEAQIGVATREAEEQGIRGKDLTPFLLQRLFELTAGRSLKANIALVRSNAVLAAKLAVALSASTDRPAGRG